MTTANASRRLLTWAAVLLLTAAIGFAAVEVTRISFEHSYKNVLDTEAKRRAIEIMGVTMNGNVMGSVAAMGLVSQKIKSVGRGQKTLDSEVIEVFEAIGKAYDANGVYVVNSGGIVKSCWFTMGKTLTGVDVKFRPYFQIAMQGKQNVYAAIGTTTGQRSLYFAAPLYDKVSGSSPVIGATVARLNLDRVDSILKAWPGPSLLLSPQQITFASNHENWIEQMATGATPEQLKSIRALKQFGNTYDNGTPKTLPFDLSSEIVSVDNHRYAVARAAVQWNDPHGDWTLVLLGDLDELMPSSLRTVIFTASSALILALSAIFMAWRERLQRANTARDQAEAELKTYTLKLESDSMIKSYLAEVAADLHQAGSTVEFARIFMHHVTSRIEADYGAFYLWEEKSNHLIPIGGHGALPDELQQIKMGQGLVGQCAKGRTPINLSDDSNTDIRIVWGNGKIAPKSIVILPVVSVDHLLGVIVFAALQSIDSEKRALLDAMMPMVAINLEILERNLNTQTQAEILARQQAQLLDTETWYRGIIESAPDGMLVADENGVIILTNPRVDEMFGYRSGFLIGQKLEILVPDDVRNHHPKLREGFMHTGTTRDMGVLDKELRGVRQDGSEFPVEVGLSRLPALGGHGMCVCASVRDMSQRRKNQV